MRAAVDACVEAGAVSVSALALHLRAGVREHYMNWLADGRPDLVGLYERRFRRAYQPAEVQRALTARVRTMVAEARGRHPAPKPAPTVTPNMLDLANGSAEVCGIASSSYSPSTTPGS